MTFLASFFILGLASYEVFNVSADDTGEFMDLQKRAFTTCSRENPLDQGIINDYANNIHVPNDPNTKCWLSCVLRIRGVVKEGWTADWETSRVQTKLTVNSDEDRAKVDVLADSCAKEVSKVGADDCELAFEMAKCKIDQWKKLGLPHNIWKE